MDDPVAAAFATFAARVDALGGDSPQIVARQHYRLSAVTCDQPLLIVPLEGTKAIHDRPGAVSAKTGDFLFVHRAASLDMENTPEEALPYRAWFLSFPWPLIQLARQFLQQQPSDRFPVPRQRTVSTGTLPPLLPALLAVLDVQTRDNTEQDYAKLGLLLALARSGHGDFLRAEEPGLAPRIRLMVTADPGRDWASVDFETAFNISAATLRRRLTAENCGLRDVLREARLHHALALLQTRNLPLKTVALRSGYRSLASFRQNFTERFGIAPGEVGAHPP